MDKASKLLGELLRHADLIDAGQLERALAHQANTRKKIGEVLVELGFTTMAAIRAALSVQLGEAPLRVAPPGAGGPVRSIVLVDDSSISIAVIADELVEAGYHVESTEDAREALALIERFRPTAVITDLDMPEIRGDELCRRVKNAYPGLPVVILTANDDAAKAAGGLAAGADDYVRKSSNCAELVARLEAIIRRTGEARRIRETFERYTAPAVVEEILSHQQGFAWGGDARAVTVLFADIRGFTTMSERMEPTKVVELLNKVLSLLSEAVVSEGGILDKFLGDGCLGVFGAPVRHEDDALRAVRAALKIQQAIAGFSRRCVEWGMPPVEVGVGVNTGRVIAGSIGGEQRTEYTVVGDAVNVAARLEKMAMAGEVLLGETTYHEVAGRLRIEIDTLPAVTVKGKSQPISVYRVRTPKAVELTDLRVRAG